jgi:hypothetical protein
VKHHFLLRFEIAAAFDLASALELAPHAFKLSSKRVGSPLGFFSGPGMLPILAKNDARRGLSPALTGALSVPPVSALYEALPLAFSPPAGFLPSLRVQAAVIFAFQKMATVYQAPASLQSP